MPLSCAAAPCVAPECLVQTGGTAGTQCLTEMCVTEGHAPRVAPECLPHARERLRAPEAVDARASTARAHIAAAAYSHRGRRHQIALARCGDTARGPRPGAAADLRRCCGPPPGHGAAAFRARGLPPGRGSVPSRARRGGAVRRVLGPPGPPRLPLPGPGAGHGRLACGVRLRL